MKTIEFEKGSSLDYEKPENSEQKFIGSKNCFIAYCPDALMDDYILPQIEMGDDMKRQIDERQ